MVSPESFDREYVAIVEEHVWPFIARIGQCLANHSYQAFLADSSGVRCHVEQSRDLGDIDFVLPANTDAEFLLQCIRSELASVSQDLDVVECIPVFLRTKLPMRFSYRGQNAFIVDFHFGGSVYDGKVIWTAPSRAYFERVRWLEVPNISRSHFARLPTLPLEDLVGLKLSKNLRLDDVDVLVALSADVFNVCAVDSSLQDPARVATVLDRTIDRFDSVFELALLYYGPQLAGRRSIIENRLLELAVHVESLL